MTKALTLRVARWLLVGGELLSFGYFVNPVLAEEPALRPAPALELRPVPDEAPSDEDCGDGGACSLPPSEKGEKLVLVSAEIDGDADRPHVSEVEGGSSSRRARKNAINDLPTQHLSHPQRQAVHDVLDSLSVFRRLPAFRCELDPRVHEYFVAHPDVAVSIWRAMAISQLQMDERKPFQYDIDTHDGTTGVVTVLHQTPENCLVHCEGMFKSPFLGDAIHSKSLMHLRTSFAKNQQGRVFATLQADLFVAFPSQSIGTIAKLISPVSNAIIDRNFEEVCLFIHVMWQAMTKQPGWVEQIAGRLDGVAAERKAELIKLTADVYVAAQTDLRQRNGLPVSLEIIQPPAGRAPQSAASPPIDVTR